MEAVYEIGTDYLVKCEGRLPRLRAVERILLWLSLNPRAADVNIAPVAFSRNVAAGFESESFWWG